MLKLRIEQIAICPADPKSALRLLTEMGAHGWHRDHVLANGEVRGRVAKNEADLLFNYDMITGNEFELLHYTSGDNWMRDKDRYNSVSHLGMHCGAQELTSWKEFFANRNIGIVQEVMTASHTNPTIAGKRRYHYCIFDTRAILGVDLKFIVRLPA